MVGWLEVLFHDAFSLTTLHSVDDTVICEWRWIARDLVGHSRDLILRHYLGIRLVGLRKTTKNSNGIAGRRGRNLNPGPLEYEWLLINRRRRSRWQTTPSTALNSLEIKVFTWERHYVFHTSISGSVQFPYTQHNSPNQLQKCTPCESRYSILKNWAAWEQTLIHVRFPVLTTTSLKMALFLDVAPLKSGRYWPTLRVIAYTRAQGKSHLRNVGQ
jgi:hypothetical protein